MIHPKRFAPGDLLVLALVLVLSFFLFAAIQRAPAAGITVKLDGRPYGRWELKSSPDTVSIAGKMRIAFDRNGVRVLDAECPRRLCQHQGMVSRAGQSIICTPNRICVSLTGGEGVDAEVR